MPSPFVARIRRLLSRAASAARASFEPFRRQADRFSDVGRVMTFTLMLFLAIGGLLELFQPGFVANGLSPGWLAAGLLLAVILSLAAPAPRWTPLNQGLFLLFAVSATVVIAWVAWSRLVSQPNDRDWLAAAVGLTVAACFWLFRPSMERLE